NGEAGGNDLWAEPVGTRARLDSLRPAQTGARDARPRRAGRPAPARAGGRGKLHARAGDLPVVGRGAEGWQLGRVLAWCQAPAHAPQQTIVSGCSFAAETRITSHPAHINACSATIRRHMGVALVPCSEASGPAE